jgi:hypothetical protein
LLVVAGKVFFSPAKYQPSAFSPSQDQAQFNLLTRVTPQTWPELQKYARPGDLYWGRVNNIPVGMRAYSFTTFQTLVDHLTDAQALNYTAINLDGEYKDFAQALTEAPQIRAWVDNFNARHAKDSGFSALKFVAFYHLNIIDTYPQIINYPDIVVVGKSNWSGPDLAQNAAPYINLIKKAGKVPAVLLGDNKKDKALLSPEKYTSQEILSNFYSLIDTPPTGLGIVTVGYYYNADDSDNLLFALKNLRR